MEIEKNIHENLRVRYNPEGSDLRKAQYGMLEILKFIDKVCSEHHLTYWLMYGTLLGAARHGGFIPWDDDVDICMPRKDFHKLRRLMKDNPNDRFILHNHSIDKNYFCSWDVMRDLHHDYFVNTKIHNIRKYKGLQVDIFPVTEYVNTKLRGWSNQIQIRYIDKQIEKGGRMFLVRMNYILLNYLLNPIFRLISYRFHKKGFYYMDFGCIFSRNIKICHVYPLAKIEFEGSQFNAPNKVDDFLTDIYGDWRKIPDTIHTHNFVFK